MGLLLGARLEGGIVGFGVLILIAILLAFAFAALSNGLAVVLRQRESVIGSTRSTGRSRPAGRPSPLTPTGP